MIEAYVLQFKRPLDSVQQLVQLYSTSQGQLTETFKFITDTNLPDRLERPGRHILRKQKQFSLPDLQIISQQDQLRQMTTVNELFGVYINRLKYTNYTKYSDIHTKLQGQNYQFMRIELAWVQKEGVSSLIQIDFMLYKESDFYLFSSKMISSDRDHYLDLYKHKKWEELFNKSNRCRYVVVMNMPQSEVVVPNKYIVQGLSAVLNTPPEITQAMLFIQKYLGLSDANFVHSWHSAALVPLTRLAVNQHSPWNDFIAFPAISGHPALCVLYEGFLVVFSVTGAFYSEQVAFNTESVFIFSAVIQSNYLVVMKSVVYDQIPIKRVFMQFSLSYQLINSLSESGTDYLVNTKHFVVVPVDAYYINQDIDQIRPMFETASHSSRFVPDVRLQQEGVYLCDDITSIYYIFNPHHLILFADPVSKDLVPHGLSPQYVNYTPFALKAVQSGVNCINVRDYFYGFSSVKTNVYVPINPLFTHTTNIYWQPSQITDQNPHFCYFKFQPAANDTEQWVPVYHLPDSMYQLCHSADYVHDFLINSVNPLTFTDLVARSSRPANDRADFQTNPNLEVYRSGTSVSLFFLDMIYHLFSGGRNQIVIAYSGDLSRIPIKALVTQPNAVFVKKNLITTDDFAKGQIIASEYKQYINYYLHYVPPLLIESTTNPKSTPADICILLDDHSYFMLDKNPQIVFAFTRLQLPGYQFVSQYEHVHIYANKLDQGESLRMANKLLNTLNLSN